MSIMLDNFKKGIVVIPTQGLGNRFRMMACTYALCRKLNLKMFINWESAPECTILLDELLDNSSNTHLYNTITPKLLNNTNQKYLFHGLIHAEQFINNLSNIPEKYDYLVIMGGHEFKLKSMNINEFLYYKNEFYQTIKFSEVVNAELSNYDNYLNRNYIGIHYRGIQQAYDSADINNPIFMSKPYNPVDFIINSPLNEFIDIIRHLKSNLPLLIISNTPDIIINKIKNEFPNKEILITYPSKFERNNSDAIISSFVDMILLSRSKLIIGTYYSSFSDEAALFSCVPKITPVSDYIKSNPKLSEGYHSYGYGVYITFSNYIYFGLYMSNYHMIKYFTL